HVGRLTDGVLDELDAAVGHQEVGPPGVVAGGHGRAVLLGPAAGRAVGATAHDVRSVGGLDRVEEREVEPADAPVAAGPRGIFARDGLFVAVGVAGRLHLLEHRELDRVLGVAGDGIARRGDRPAPLPAPHAVGDAPPGLLAVAAGLLAEGDRVGRAV